MLMVATVFIIFDFAQSCRERCKLFSYCELLIKRCQASGVRELLEAKGTLGGGSGAPRAQGLYVRRGEQRGEVEEEVDEEEVEAHTLPRSHKAARIKVEWEELMARCHGEDWGSHTLPRTGNREESVRSVLTVQEKLHSGDTDPPAAEVYVNLLEEEEVSTRYESDDTASTVSNTCQSQLPTPAASSLPTPVSTPHSSFSRADRQAPPPAVGFAGSTPLIDLATLLDPFEQLEREWETSPGVQIPPSAAPTIRPPSAFCSLTDIQEEERVREVEEVEVEKVRSERKEEQVESDKGGGSDEGGGGGSDGKVGDQVIGESELDDSGIHSDLVEEEEDSAPKSRLDSAMSLTLIFDLSAFSHILTFHCLLQVCHESVCKSSGQTVFNLTLGKHQSTFVLQLFSS